MGIEPLIALFVSTTTSAPQAAHLNVITSAASGMMSADPEPTTTPCRCWDPPSRWWYCSALTAGAS